MECLQANLEAKEKWLLKALQLIYEKNCGVAKASGLSLNIYQKCWQRPTDRQLKVSYWLNTQLEWNTKSFIKHCYSTLIQVINSNKNSLVTKLMFKLTYLQMIYIENVALQTTYVLYSIHHISFQTTNKKKNWKHSILYYTASLGVKKCLAVPMINFKLATQNLWQLHKPAMSSQTHSRVYCGYTVLYSNNKHNNNTVLKILLRHGNKCYCSKPKICGNLNYSDPNQKYSYNNIECSWWWRERKSA